MNDRANWHSEKARISALEQQVSRLLRICEALKQAIDNNATALQRVQENSLKHSAAIGHLHTAFEAISADTEEEQPSASH